MSVMTLCVSASSVSPCETLNIATERLRQMNLELSPEDLAFRDEVRAFLDKALTPALRDAGRRATSVFTDKQYSIAWQKILYVKGWVAPSWPKEYGGTGWNDMQRYIFSRECARA